MCTHFHVPRYCTSGTAWSCGWWLRIDTSTTVSTTYRLCTIYFPLCSLFFSRRRNSPIIYRPNWHKSQMISRWTCHSYKHIHLNISIFYIGQLVNRCDSPISSVSLMSTFTSTHMDVFNLTSLLSIRIRFFYISID